MSLRFALPLTGILLLLFAVSCQDQEARRPVQSRKGTFYEISAERAQALLRQEQQAMQELMNTDSTRSYRESAYGFWYAYTRRVDSAAPQPEPGDLAIIRYQLSDISGSPFYTFRELDTLAYRVDRDERIFKGLRDAVKVLRRGEQARFLIPSSLAYGFAGDGDRIGSAVPLAADLELINVIKPEESN